VQQEAAGGGAAGGGAEQLTRGSVSGSRAPGGGGGGDVGREGAAAVVPGPVRRLPGRVHHQHDHVLQGRPGVLRAHPPAPTRAHVSRTPRGPPKEEEGGGVCAACLDTQRLRVCWTSLMEREERNSSGLLEEPEAAREELRACFCRSGS